MASISQTKYLKADTDFLSPFLQHFIAVDVRALIIKRVVTAKQLFLLTDLRLHHSRVPWILWIWLVSPCLSEQT